MNKINTISDSKKIKGRGAQIKVNNRFSAVQYEHDHAFNDFSFEELESSEKTSYTKVYPKTLINKVPSADIFLDFSMNAYQGCEHGCVYCYARTTHEYWGYGPGLDFERKIMYKPDAAKLLRKELMKKSWKAAPIMMSGNTDCYQPIEQKLKLTRSLLEVLQAFKNPVGIITKNALVTRDIDILSEMASERLVKVIFSINTVDEDLRRKLEPRTSSAANKMKAITSLSKAGIPVQVLIGPVIPGLNSHEIPEIIKMSAEAGANWANYVGVRLNGAVAEIFENWLRTEYPDRAEKVLNQIKSNNHGKLWNTIEGGRMKGSGKIADMIRSLVEINRKKYMVKDETPFNCDAFVRPGQQLDLF